MMFSDAHEKLTEEHQKLHVEFLEQKQQLDKLNVRLKYYSRVRGASSSSFHLSLTVEHS